MKKFFDPFVFTGIKYRAKKSTYLYVGLER